MTELDRSRRSQDLYDLVSRLEHYRDFDPERQTDLSQIPGWVDKGPTQRDGVILNKLRNRLSISAVETIVVLQTQFAARQSYRKQRPPRAALSKHPAGAALYLEW